MSQPAIDEEEAHPHFLLSTGPVRGDAVAAVLGVLQPAGLLLRPEAASLGNLGVVGELHGIAEKAGVAFFVEDNIDLALQVAADGVQLCDISHVQNARERLSRDHLIGASAGLSRHDAMTAGEHGADYLVFGEEDTPLTNEIIELVQWWRSTTVLPCLAYATDREEVKRLADIGTDFIGVSSAIWDHPDGPVTAAADLTAVMKKAEAYRCA